MTKKRQADFAKVNLKPGRSLAKRRNITHTNFKATKIVVQKQEFKQTSDITIVVIIFYYKFLWAKSTKKCETNSVVYHNRLIICVKNNYNKGVQVCHILFRKMTPVCISSCPFFCWFKIGLNEFKFNSSNIKYL